MLYEVITRTRKEKPLKNPLLIAADGAVGGGIQRLSNAYRTALDYVLRHRLAAVIV